MSHHRLIIFLLPACLALACAGPEPSAGRSERIEQKGHDGVLATSQPSSAPTISRVGLETHEDSRRLRIDSEYMTPDDVLEPIRIQLERAASTLSERGYYEYLARQIRQQIITEVAERLVWREAGRRLDAEREKRLDEVVKLIERDRIRDEFGGVEARYEAFLAAQNITRESVRTRLRRRLVVQEFVRERIVSRVKVTRQELMRYYIDHIESYESPHRVEMFLIDIPIRSLLKPHELRDPERREAAFKVAREELAEAHRRITAGEVTFADAARQYSRGLHASDGGCWGMITEPCREYWEEPSRVALAMEAGAISDVRENEHCVYIVHVGKVDPGRTISFEDAQPEIALTIRGERTSALEREFLQQLVERSAMGELDPFVQAVVREAPEWKRIQRPAPDPGAVEDRSVPITAP